MNSFPTTYPLQTTTQSEVYIKKYLFVLTMNEVVGVAYRMRIAETLIRLLELFQTSEKKAERKAQFEEFLVYIYDEFKLKRAPTLLTRRTTISCKNILAFSTHQSHLQQWRETSTNLKNGSAVRSPRTVRNCIKQKHTGKKFLL